MHAITSEMFHHPFLNNFVSGFVKENVTLEGMEGAHSSKKVVLFSCTNF